MNSLKRTPRMVLVAVFFPSILALGDERDGGLMPMPARIAFGPGSMTVGDSLSVFLNGPRDPRIDNAVDRFVDHLTQFAGRSIRRENSESDEGTNVVLRYSRPGQAIQTLDENESYTLTIVDEQIRLDADTAVGVLRGLATLEQLIQRSGHSLVFPDVRIDDKPRFPWRGLLIDVCRHWQPIDVIKRNLNAMAAVKLNVLHLHLSEDQGFRVESKRFPLLHQRGSDGDYFSQDELREIVAYARDRGIRVVPEFDMPGHSTSWLVGYPELAAGEGPFQIERRWGVFDPCFDPTKESLYEFLDSFFEEMVDIFPDPYMHIGGDEVNGVQWNANPRIQAFMKEKGLGGPHALQAYFNRRVAAILAKYGRTMIGWDEILGEGLPDNCVVQSWRGADSLTQTIHRGFDAILSNGYYLDHQRPASFHYVNDPDPLQRALARTGSARILGGEACMWTEFVSPETIDSRIWPRLAAIAERLWSPVSINDVDDMYRRLDMLSVQLDRMGVKHAAHYEAMLGRLTGGRSIDSLRVLADVVEPVKFYKRSASRDYTSRTPLNRLVDAARPESDTARKFRSLVEKYLSNKPTEVDLDASIRKSLRTWKGNHAELLPAIRSSDLLREIEPVSAHLRGIAEVGLQALARFESGNHVDAEWKTKATSVLDAASKPHAEVEIAVVPGVRSLVLAVTKDASRVPN